MTPTCVHATLSRDHPAAVLSALPSPSRQATSSLSAQELLSALADQLASDLLDLAGR
jgi:hypothetical protein